VPWLEKKEKRKRKKPEQESPLSKTYRRADIIINEQYDCQELLEGVCINRKKGK
jgi:hypothetical protein